MLHLYNISKKKKYYTVHTTWYKSVKPSIKTAMVVS